MRIAYVALVAASEETGVLKKIAGQLRAWRSAGHDGALFVLGRATSPWSGLSDIPVQLFATHDALSWFARAEHLVDAVIAYQPTVVYHRFGVHFPALERMQRRCATVVELNSLDVPEYRASLSGIRFAYHLVTRGRIFRGARAIVAVTSEIADSVARFRRPTLVLGNGIDLSTFEVAPPTRAERPTLVFIAAKPGDSWHGLDKLLDLARALPAVNVNLIGCGPDALSGAPHNVVAHGFLGQAHYRALIVTSDVGVGPLALHRKHMDEACPLKTREYLAMGLPVIAAHRDPDFPQSVPFLLELPNHEHNIEPALGSIREFVARWQGKRVERSSIAHLDTTVKEAKRLAFLQEVASDRTSFGPP